jgi:hypothetical protein
MRFSLKWLLAGIGYLVLATAAFARPHWVYSEILRGVAFFALVYALAAAIFGRGQRRVAAAGFAIAALLLLLYADLYPARMPTSHFYRVFWGESAEAGTFGERVEAFEAIGTMAAGLVGSILGVIVYRRGRVGSEGG